MKPLKTLLVCLTIFFSSCDNKTTLQEYYVENQNNRQFLALDIPASLLTGNNRLSADQKATLETIRKVNLIALPMNDENREIFEEERTKLTAILGDEKYQPLIKYGGGTRKAELYFLGEEDAIDEFIVFGYDEEKGFGVARVLGDDMEPDALMKLLKSFEEGDLNIEGLQNLTSGFEN